jgi:hypothetical protein
MKMEVKFVFLDWQRGLNSIYYSEEALEYTEGDLHSGATFSGTIEINDGDAERIKLALSRDAAPVLYIKNK